MGWLTRLFAPKQPPSPAVRIDPPIEDVSDIEEEDEDKDEDEERVEEQLTRLGTGPVQQAALAGTMPVFAVDGLAPGIGPIVETSAGRVLVLDAIGVAVDGARVFAAAGSQIRTHDLEGNLLDAGTVTCSALGGIAVRDPIAVLAADDDVVVLEVDTLVERMRFGGGYGVSAVVILDDDRIGAGDQRACFRVWSLSTAQLLASFKIDDAIMVLGTALSPDGTRLAVVTDSGGAVLIDTHALAVIAKLEHGGAAAWLADGRLCTAALRSMFVYDRDGALQSEHQIGDDTVYAFVVTAQAVYFGLETGELAIGAPVTRA